MRIVPPVPGLWQCFTHTGCVCNELVSATNRVLGVTPLPTPGGLKRLRTESKRLASICGTLVPWTADQVLNSFRGARRARYEQAAKSLLVKPLDSNDARINSFVKAEKFDPSAKVNPDPRMIQARDPRYNLRIAQYLRPVEHFIYNLQGPNGMRCVAKGLNQKDRAELFLKKWERFSNPVCFSIDCSRWDKHVSSEVLRIEHQFYRMCLPQSPELEMLLNWQQLNRCRTAGGVKYTVYGGRMSGDINTALGNCLLMVLMVRTAMRELFCKYDLFDDGDDCLVIVERDDFQIVKDRLADQFLEFGQALKIENVAYRPWDVIFCQAKLVYNGLHWLFARDWRKVLSQSCCGTKHWNEPVKVRPMLGLIGSCELALSAGVPVLQSFALACQRMSGGRCAAFNAADPGLAYRVQLEGLTLDAKARPITQDARMSFELAFGVPVWEQEAIESILERWTLDTEVSDEYPLEWTADWTDFRSTEVLSPSTY